MYNMTPSPEKLLNIIESDESIRKALRALNELIEPSSLSMKESMSQGYNGIWVSGVGVFIRTKKFDAHAEKIRVRLTRTFGAFADEVWFAGCIIQYAGEVLKKRENATIKFFCSIVAKAVHRTLVAFPCRNIKLLNVDVIDLGYSKVYSADSLLKLLEPNFEKSGVTNADFTSNLGHISIFFEGWGVAKFAAAEAYWVVDTSAPTELWGEYLEIAAQRSLSLLRCHIDPFDVLEENLISYYPHQTDVEVDPILGWTDWSNKVIVRDGVILKEVEN